MRDDEQEKQKQEEQGKQKKEKSLFKGVGVSPKLSFIAGTIASILLMGIMLTIFHYKSAKTAAAPSNQIMLAKQQATITPDDEIRAMNQNQHNGALITAEPTTAVASTTATQDQEDDQAQVSNNQQANHALSSPISVLNNFQGTSASANNNTSANAAPLTINMPSATNTDKTTDSYQAQNGQDQKTAFLQANQSSSSNFYLSSQLTKPVSPYEVKAGTIIPATLVTGIDSDLPGEIIAEVSQNVYDTVTGNYLLIPQGTRVIGVYDSKVAYGQSRVLIAWSRLIYPNGDSFDLQGQPGADLMGMAGLEDQVNNHYVRIFGSAVAFSLFGALGQLSQPQQSQNASPSNAQIIYGAIGQNMTQAGIQLTEKNMNIQPTITIRPGANFNILLTRDMVLPGAYHYAS